MKFLSKNAGQGVSHFRAAVVLLFTVLNLAVFCLHAISVWRYGALFFGAGGASSVIGVMLIDDLSVRLSKPYISAATGQPGDFNLTWNSMASKNYTVQFTGTLSPTPTWTTLATNIPGAFPTTFYLDTVSHGGRQGYYRILQQ